MICGRICIKQLIHKKNIKKNLLQTTKEKKKGNNQKILFKTKKKTTTQRGKDATAEEKLKTQLNQIHRTWKAGQEGAEELDYVG